MAPGKHSVQASPTRTGQRASTWERVREPVVLRFAVRGNLSLLLGRPLHDVLRKSHFLVFRFEGEELQEVLAIPGDPDAFDTFWS